MQVSFLHYGFVLTRTLSLMDMFDLFNGIERVVGKKMKLWKRQLSEKPLKKLDFQSDYGKCLHSDYPWFALCVEYIHYLLLRSGLRAVSGDFRVLIGEGFIFFSVYVSNQWNSTQIFRLRLDNFLIDTLDSRLKNFLRLLKIRRVLMLE